MTIPTYELAHLDGRADALTATEGRVTLVVNVASKCGLTPQYQALQALQDEYSDQGFTVIGIPCNQFLGQEPGTPDDIAEFCSTHYGVTFPLTEKIEVNGEGRHPLYVELTAVADAEGYTGDIRWNFEKFLVGRDGSVVARFAPQVAPDDPTITNAIEAALAS